MKEKDFNEVIEAISNYTNTNGLIFVYNTETKTLIIHRSMDKAVIETFNNISLTNVKKLISLINDYQKKKRNHDFFIESSYDRFNDVEIQIKF